VDRWTLVHAAFFFVLGADWMGLGLPQHLGVLALPLALIASLVLAFGWELLEGALEKRGLVKHPESKLNRWVSDPIFDTLGFFIGYWWILGQ
jgi:hypothetical protein